MLAALFPIGLTGRYERLVSAEDLRVFGALTGDIDPIHFDEEFCRQTPYGRPIANAALLVGFMAAASVSVTRESRVPLVSLGYDRIRFIRPVFVGDVVEAVFKVTGHDEARGRILADVEIRSRGELAAVAGHILKRVD